MSFTNIEQWRGEFRLAALKRLNQCSKIHNEATKLLYSRIVEYTPIGNPELWQQKPSYNYIPGALKDSWKVSTGGVRSTQTGRYTGDASLFDTGYNAQSGIQTKIQNVSIYNTRPYAYRVEYLGWSTQAPAGMMRKANMEWAEIVKEAEKATK